MENCNNYFKYDTPYELTEDFDIYQCNFGRTTVLKGAQFVIPGSQHENWGRVYFLNSKNCLPSYAKAEFFRSAHKVQIPITEDMKW
jgi:hypothetical protein